MTKDKYNCICGVSICLTSVQRHLLTRRHRNFIAGKPNCDPTTWKSSKTVICQCGGRYLLKNEHNHITTVKHFNYMDKLELGKKAVKQLSYMQIRRNYTKQKEDIGYLYGDNDKIIHYYYSNDDGTPLENIKYGFTNDPEDIPDKLYTYDEKFFSSH